MLKKITHNPYLNILTGIIILFTAGYETWLEFEEGQLGAHHGLLVFGFTHILKYLPDCMHGLKTLEEADQPKA